MLCAFHWLDGGVDEVEIPESYLERGLVRIDRPREPTVTLDGSLVITDSRTRERGTFEPRTVDGVRTYHQTQEKES